MALIVENKRYNCVKQSSLGHLAIISIPALYYAGMVHNGLLTTNLVLVWLSNKNKRIILPNF